MLATEPPPAGADAILPSEEATCQLAVEVATALKPGDVVLLSGDLGSGKTTFARALIRHLAGDLRLDVPSPTFTLVQSYDLPAYPLVHLDLYRIGSESELDELGLQELTEGAVTLVEWPERAGDALPAPRMEISFALAPDLGPNGRRVQIVTAEPVPAIEKLLNFHRFMHEAGFGTAQRVRLQGDASTRIYERLFLGERRAILMLAPRRPDGPPVRDGKPYSRIAHLAEDVTPFVAMARALRERGFSAPEIYAADLSEGWLILEDLGSEPVASGDPPAPIEERYAAAVDALVALHTQSLPDTLPVAPSVSYTLPTYDIEALLIEVELLLDWYLEQQHGRRVDEEMRLSFRVLWAELLTPVLAAPPIWVLRDYHSPNLLWLPARQGVGRVGILDFQDAVMGSAAYDVVSLLQDARVDVPIPKEDDLFNRYMRGRRQADREFDLVGFVELYAILGAQRATKILGIFARLDRRDAKPQYLRHQPRVWRNLRRSLAHPMLAKLKAWYDANVPAPRAH